MLVWPMTEAPRPPAHEPERESAELRVLVRAVVASILRAAPSHPDVDDATNEALRRALEGQERVRPGESVRGWVVGIARNVARDVLRRRAREQRRLAPEPAPDSSSTLTERLPDAAPSPLERALRTEQVARVRGALSALPDGQRRAVELFHLEGESYQAIAQRLGVPVGTVATWILRARHALVVALREEDQ